MARILVAGATGDIGRRVVRRLRERGDVPVLLVRSRARAEAAFGGDVEVREGDVRDVASLSGAGAGVDAAISAIGSRTWYGSNGSRAVDADGAAHLARALAADGVPHLVQLSAFGLDRTSPWLSLFSLALNGYFPAKQAAEDAVRACGVAYTLVRPVEFASRAPRGRPRLSQAEPLSLLQRVSRDLVAEVLVACAGNPHAAGKTFELTEGGDDEVEVQLEGLAEDATRPRPAYTPLFGG